MTGQAFFLEGSRTVRSRLIGWIFVLVVPAVTLAAMNASPPPNLAETLEVQRALVAEYPQDARVWNDLGNLLVLAGRTEEAEQAYGRALELEPAKTSARFNLGLLQQQKGKYRKALGHYQKVIETAPDFAWAYYQLGTLYDHWKQDAKAVSYYAKALSVNPQLAFPEINPHVIDNRLFTQALLKANRTPLAGQLAPKAYDEPGRITTLLLPKPPSAEGEEEGGEEALAGEEPGRAPPDRVLSEGNLDPRGPSNQATPQRSGRYRGTTRRPSAGIPSSRFGSGSRRIPSSEAAGRRQPVTRQPVTRERQPDTRTQGAGVPVTRGLEQRQEEARPDEGGQAGRGRGQGGGAVPRGQPRTGTASTGRLEIDLVPRDPEVVEAG